MEAARRVPSDSTSLVQWVSGPLVRVLAPLTNVTQGDTINAAGLSLKSLLFGISEAGKYLLAVRKYRTSS